MLPSHWLKYARALKKKGCDSEGITNCSSLLTQVIPDESDSAYIFDERFHLFSQLFPTKLQIVSSVNKSDATPKQTLTMVYYIAGQEANAANVAAALGGVATAPMPDPVPTETGNMGEASVLVFLATDLAGKPIAGAPAATTTVAG